ncbi:MAG: hypothetical protein R2715_08180 [Ilumatobacteraceae bacterium]
MAPGSPADSEAGWRRATRSAASTVRYCDVIEWRMLTDDESLELDVLRGGVEQTLEISSGPE